MLKPILLSLLLFFSLSSSGGSEKKNSVSIMAYNLENFFDAKHDPGTFDHTYLPLSQKNGPEHEEACRKSTSNRFYFKLCLTLDWSEKVLEEKMKRLAEAVLQINNGLGPDILITPEVENRSVLETWNRKYLKAAGYTSIAHVEGPDKRGIDVAIFSRIPMIGKPHLYKIPFKGKTQRDTKWMKRSRGILKATYKMSDGTPLTVFGVHFPSPANPKYWRVQAFDFLKKITKKVPKNHMVVAGGDFNIISTEAKTYYTKKLRKTWAISHIDGCKDCPGTYYYMPKRNWSFLDVLLFRKNNPSSWSLKKSSVFTPNKGQYQNSKYGHPARFDYKKTHGATDHWPIYGEIHK